MGAQHVAMLEDDPDMICGDCGEGVFAEDAHLVEAWERWGSVVCCGCFDDRCEDDAAEDEEADDRRRDNPLEPDFRRLG